MAAFVGKCVAVESGDTIVVLQDGELTRVRLWGMDCPRLPHTEGQIAKHWLKALALDKAVTVRVKPDAQREPLAADVFIGDGRYGKTSKSRRSWLTQAELDEFLRGSYRRRYPVTSGVTDVQVMCPDGLSLSDLLVQERVAARLGTDEAAQP